MMNLKSSDLVLLQKRAAVFCYFNAAINITKASSNFLFEQKARSVYLKDWILINKDLVSCGEKGFRESSRSSFDSCIENIAEELPKNSLDLSRNNVSGPRRVTSMDDKIVEMLMDIQKRISDNNASTLKELSDIKDSFSKQISGNNASTLKELGDIKVSVLGMNMQLEELKKASEKALAKKHSIWSTVFLFASPTLAVIVGYFLR